MIIEILKKQVIKIKWEAIEHSGNNLKASLYEITIDDKKYYEAIPMKINIVYFALEQACRQYVKENGFKLEWLDNVEKDISYINIDMWCFDFYDKERESKYGKLIAWLYANDIEIKES